MATAVRSNARQLGDLNYRRAKAFMAEARREVHTFEYAVWETAVELSSGPVKDESLSAPPPGLNHPYGYGRYNRRGPRGPVPNGGDLGIINEQTGTFKASWDTVSSVMPNEVLVILFNDAPYAKYMHGTELMRRRPILDKVQMAHRQDFLTRMARARRRALNP